MNNFFKWIGILVVANFSGLLLLPIVYLITKIDGFWSFKSFGAFLLCQFVLPPFYAFIGALINGLLNLSHRQKGWLLGLALINMIFTSVNAGASMRMFFEILIFGGYPLAMFFSGIEYK